VAVPTRIVEEAAAPALRVHVLGSAWVGSSGRRLPLPASAAHTLALLAMVPEEQRSRTRVATQLFADCAESIARRRLSTALWRLRTELRTTVGHEVIDSTNASVVSLHPDVELRVDAQEFRELVTPVLDRPPETLTEQDAQVLETATSYYTGALLESLDDPWVVAERGSLANLFLTVLDHLVQYHGLHGNAAQVTAYATRALEAEPLREDLHRHVMVAFHRVGRPDLADRQFEMCRLALLRELGADPMPETVALHSRITVGAGPTPGGDLAGLVSDLERARRDVRQLAALVERALDTVIRLR
jgi:DNA-binding SARP family transcriptional activator